MTIVVVGFSMLLAGAQLEGRGLRIGPGAVLPLVFLLIPVLQSIPMPVGVRSVLDPKGTALLTDLAVTRPTVWPLSLDPPSTRVHIGKAAAALAVFLVAYHVASGRKRRYLLTRAIGLTGVAAVLIGLGHKVFGFSKIYGILISTHRTLLMGPFVNANHTAELLELAAFACLACSFQRPTSLNRVGWLGAMVVCAGGAAATLSRGAVMGAMAAVLLFAFLRHLAPPETDKPSRARRTSLAWGGLLLGLVILAAGALGAGQLLDRFRAGVGGELRFAVWRDSLRVLIAHPMGIGRGAFDRVFPVYRTLKTLFPVRFAFVENHPLQILIDAGWAFSLVVIVATVFVGWQIVRHGRRDRIEAALVAGLFAVIVHNLVDFGLDTLGVLLPFMAILGTILGRLGLRELSLPRLSRPIVAACGLGLLIGVGSVAHASYDDFDELLKRSSPVDARRDLLWRAQSVHPIDYFYPLQYARLEPLRSVLPGPSPRFRALNRALGLCAGCETVHAEVARNLWALGRRGQSLLEWRFAVQLQPKLLTPVLEELFAAGAKPEEIASIATSDPSRMVEIAAFLGSMSRVDDAMIVLSQAEALGVPTDELLLTRAQLQLQAGKPEAAALTLSRAHATGTRDVRLALLDAQLRVDQGGKAGPEQALAILDAAATQYPTDLGVQRMRLDLVMRFEKWQMSDRALEGLKEALYQSGGSVAEAHIAAARIYSRLARWTNALGEYRIALADQAGNGNLWTEYGHAAETIGRYPTAREAYSEAARLSPSDPAIREALKTLDERTGRSRRDTSGRDRGEAAP